MAKKDQKPKTNLTASDYVAVELTGLPYGEKEVRTVRDLIKEKSALAAQGGQFYEITDDTLWADTADEMDARLFAATRLIAEYDSPSGKHVHNKAGRRANLLALVERIATVRSNQKALEGLEILKRAGDKEAPSALQPIEQKR